MRNYLGVVVMCQTLMLATFAATGSNGFQPIECDVNGGFLVSSTCVCNYGYTGHKCDVTLFVDDAIEQKSLTDTRVYTFESRPRLAVERFKRQSEISGSGSGEETTTSPEMTSPEMTSSEETNTPSGSVSCEFPQAFHEGACVNVTRFALGLTLGGEFDPQLGDNASEEFVNFTRDLVEFIEQAMTNTGLVDVTITELRNGSIIASGEILFEEDEPMTSLEATILLQERLRGSDDTTYDFLVISAQDMNECEVITNPCNSSMECQNSDGAFACICPPGYVMDETSGNCTSACDVTTCNNGGECIVIGNGTAICSCPDGFSGPECSTSINPWINGVIALAVILGIIVLVLLVYLIVFCVRRWRSKKRSVTLPLATGFRSTAEPMVMGGFDNPNVVEVEELKAPFPIEHMSHATNIKADQHTARPISMTTFRPVDDAPENAEDQL